MSDRYELISKKSVTDSDGFSTDYAMYFDNETQKYIFMFGDTDYVEPDIDYADWECETEKEANEWFSTYSGFEEEDEKLIATKTESTIEDESEAAWDLLNKDDTIRTLIIVGSLTHKYNKMNLCDADIDIESANKLIELANECKEEVDNYLNEKPFNIEKLNKSANEIIKLLKNDLTENILFDDDYDDDELASIFGGDTDEARKQLIKDMQDEYADTLEESLILITEKLSRSDIEKEIIDCVGMGFETSRVVYDKFSEFEKELGPGIEEINDPDLSVEDAWNFYNELINMGPSGFYNEYVDKYDFSEDFIAKYGKNESKNVVKESVDEDINRRIYTALDNIKFLANEYDGAEGDLGLTNLKQTIEMIEESIDTLKSIINEVVKSR